MISKLPQNIDRFYISDNEWISIETRNFPLSFVYSCYDLDIAFNSLSQQFIFGATDALSFCYKIKHKAFKLLNNQLILPSNMQDKLGILNNNYFMGLLEEDNSSVSRKIILFNFFNCMNIIALGSYPDSYDDINEGIIRRKVNEQRIEKEVSRRLAQEEAKREDQLQKNKSQKSNNQLSTEDLKVSFDLIQKNILSDDQHVQQAAQYLFDIICLDLNETQLKQFIGNLLQKLAHQSDLEKINYDKITNIFMILFGLVKKDILKSSSDLKTLFNQFKTLLFREIEENTSNEQAQNLQAKANVPSSEQYPNKKNLKLLNMLDSLLLRKPLSVTSLTLLNLENKQIFQSLFDIVQSVAQESDPKIKARGLGMLGKMVKN